MRGGRPPSTDRSRPPKQRARPHATWHNRLPNNARDLAQPPAIAERMTIPKMVAMRPIPLEDHKKLLLAVSFQRGIRSPAWSPIHGGTRKNNANQSAPAIALTILPVTNTANNAHNVKTFKACGAVVTTSSTHSSFEVRRTFAYANNTCAL